MDGLKRERVQQVVNCLAPTHHGRSPGEVRTALDAEPQRRGLALDDVFRAEIVETIGNGPTVIFNPQRD